MSKDVFLLYDNKSQLLKRVYQKVDIIQGADVSNIEVNRQYQVSLRIEKLPSSIYTVIYNVKFEKVSIIDSEANSKLLLK